MLIPLGILAATAGGKVGVAGYFLGGQFDTAIEKFAFPSDSRSVISATLSSSRPQGAGMANAGVAGYQGGGADGNFRSDTVDKFAFPADTRTTLGTGLSQIKRLLGAMANAGVAGYFGGGAVSAGSPPNTNQVEKFAFPSDTRSLLGTGLSLSRESLPGFSDSGVAGYFLGGYDGNSPRDRVDKFAFPSDTRSTLSLSGGGQGSGAFADSGVAGYYGFGDSTTVNKFAFPSDTRSNLATGLSSNGNARAGMANSGVAGYIHLGTVDGETTTQINKFAFPSDTRSGLGLSTPKTRISAFANEGL